MVNTMIGIYKILNPKNKIYIGQTSNYGKRLKAYNNFKCKGQPKLYNSLKKYGPDNHKFEIIEECSLEQLNEREIYWGKYYDVLGENGLNCKELGIGGKWNESMKIKFKKKRNTKEWKSFISSIHKNKIVLLHTREKQRNSRLGSKQSLETQQKRGIFNKHSQQHIQKYIKSKSRAIICFPLNQKFNSIKEAENILQIDHQRIIQILKGRKDSFKGLTFQYL